MKKFLLLPLLCLCFLTAKSQIVISGVLPNPAGTDSIFEYAQFVATQNINFATTPYSVVVLNNGTATTNGWAAGNALSYKFNLTAGSVTKGQTFYVGGTGKLVNGIGSASLATQTWIRTINSATTNGDGLGTFLGSGVFGNGGTNADGIGVFADTAVTATSTPIDVIFYGSGIGTAYNSATSAGYKVPTNDRYSATAGLFGAGTNTFLNPDAASAQWLRLTGEYNPQTRLWVTPRAGALQVFGTGATADTIATSIRLTPATNTVELTAKKAISIQSNLVQSDLVVTLNAADAEAITLFDLAGKAVLEQKLAAAQNDNTLTIGVAHLPKGAYIVTLRTQSSVTSERIVKQ